MSAIFQKVCIIGDFGVGKTSLVRRFLDRQFSDHYLSTIGVKISRKLLSVAMGEGIERQMHLMIWDIEGETQFQGIAPNYLQGAMGAIVVADLNRPDTIERIEKHIQLVSAVNSEDIPCIVALNKVDILKKSDFLPRLESLTNLKDYSQVIKVLTTSAKTGEQVETMFEILAARLLKNHLARKPP